MLSLTDALSLADAPPRSRPAQIPRRFDVELFDGRDLAAARWPSVAAGPELLMHAFQSLEVLDVWTATIGRARKAQCFLIVVTNSDDKKPILYLPLSIETGLAVAGFGRPTTSRSTLSSNLLVLVSCTGRLAGTLAFVSETAAVGAAN